MMGTAVTKDGPWDNPTFYSPFVHPPYPLPPHRGFCVHLLLVLWTSTGGYECTGTRIQFFEFEERTEAPAVGAIPVCVGVIVECLRYWGHATGGYGGHRWGAEPVLTGMTFDEVSAGCWGKYLWLPRFWPGWKVYQICWDKE
jgi:hypothetical protein